MVDVETAAQLLGIGRTAVYEEIRLGRLTSVKRGKSRLVPVESLKEYVNLLLTEAANEEAA
jgi:excisionase family DNA binding protein